MAGGGGEEEGEGGDLVGNGTGKSRWFMVCSVTTPFPQLDPQLTKGKMRKEQQTYSVVKDMFHKVQQVNNIVTNRIRRSVSMHTEREREREREREGERESLHTCMLT